MSGKLGQKKSQRHRQKCPGCGKTFETASFRAHCIPCIEEINKELADVFEKTPRLPWDVTDEATRKAYISIASRLKQYQTGMSADKIPMLGNKAERLAIKLYNHQPERYCLWCGEKFIGTAGMAFCTRHTKKQREKSIPQALRWERERAAGAAITPAHESEITHPKPEDWDSDQPDTHRLGRPPKEPGEPTTPQNPYHLFLDGNDLSYYEKTRNDYYAYYDIKTPADATQIEHVIMLDVQNYMINKQLLQAQHNSTRGGTGLTADDQKKLSTQLSANAKTIKDILGTLGMRYDVRTKAGLDKSLVELFADLATDAETTQRQSPYFLVCADCPKYRDLMEKIHEETLKQVEAVDRG